MRNNSLHIAILLACLCFPKINFSQAPNLRTAADFVLFTSVGAVSNTGTTHLTGNVGTNSGAITGFGNVNGVMHTADGATSQCTTDLLLAYNQLDTTTATSSHAPLLGNGDTLTAGVYFIAGNTVLDSTLILNANGNPNAVFIFQVQGTFSTTSSAKIILINNAKACNVFWKIEGLVTLVSGITMRGTIVANNAAININSGVTLEGRALSTAGAVNVNGILGYTPIGCGSAFLTGPGAPILASTACYEIFSGNGSVTNSGVTNVTGDIGTNVGLTSGYDALRVNGTIHTNPDISTAQCAADLLNVYHYLDTIPYNIELLYPAQFGNNLVLTPHTYLLNAATTFTDTLYLDGQGNANAAFVIRINGALSTSTNSKVILMNGTQAANVFWKIEGAVSINNFSVFKGTIVCNGALNLNTGTTIDGRAFTITGAVNTDAITATSPSVTCNFVLPVGWLYFQGKAFQKTVMLEWGISNDKNNGFFTLEKSSDGIKFETLTTINATGTGRPDYKYSFTDTKPNAINYYRILQTDINGQKSYFTIVQVKMNLAQNLTGFQYVQGNSIYVQASGATPGEGTIALYNTEGKKIASQKIMLTKEISIYKIEKPLEKGIHIIYIESLGKKVYEGKIIL